MSILNDEEKRKLEAKISAAEKLTSAEFKIVISNRAWFGAQNKAAALFKKLGLYKTAERNAVLLLVLVKDKELLLYGDEGIYQKSSTEHWPDVRDVILKEFKDDGYYVGLSAGVDMIAENLMQHFPHKESQGNEISNEIIFA